MDATAGTGWVDEGQLQPQWVNGGCPGSGQPFVFNPVNGHSYTVESVDFSAPDCANAPDMGCWRSLTSFVGDARGQVVTNTIG